MSGAGSLLDTNNGPAMRAKEYIRKHPDAFPLKHALGDIGGHFLLNQTKAVYNLYNVDRYSYKGIGLEYLLDGPVFPSTPGVHLVTFPSAITPLNDLQLNSYGATAISRCIPTNPAADVATFLGELRQVPKVPLTSYYKAVKKVEHDRHGSPAVLADEYLNYQFGIAPFIRDIGSIRKATAEADARLKYLARTSGKRVRREYLLTDTTTVSSDALGEFNSGFASTGANPYRRFPLNRTYTERTRIWFSGCFVHYYAQSPTEVAFFKKVRDARDVYGLDLSFEVGWNLLPYSWLVDWQSNIGDVMHNLSRFSQDGLVMTYGYIMCHTQRTYEYTYGPSSWTLTREVKQRKKASPFGFGIDPANLTSRQWSILAALGQSKFWK